jgi:hypothetical protein
MAWPLRQDGASAADAQYFGRNKVQYRSFTFEILKTEHFDLTIIRRKPRQPSWRRGSPSAGIRGLATFNHELRGR